MKELQMAQNRLLKMINNSKISDKISSKSMLKKFNLISINQLADQIKLTETWKILNLENYPVEIRPARNVEITATEHILYTHT